MERTWDALVVEIRRQLPPLETHYPRHHNAGSRLGPVYALLCHPPSRPVVPIFGSPAAHGSKTKSLPVAQSELAENHLPPRLGWGAAWTLPKPGGAPRGFRSSQQSGCRYRKATLFKHRPRVTGNLDIPCRRMSRQGPRQGRKEKRVPVFSKMPQGPGDGTLRQRSRRQARNGPSPHHYTNSSLARRASMTKLPAGLSG